MALSGHCIDRSKSYRFSLASADAFYFGAGIKFVDPCTKYDNLRSRS